MLLPDKHIEIGSSILGLASLVLETLETPLAFDRLMGILETKFETPEWPAYHSTDTVTLAVCFLYSIGRVEVTREGNLHRCG